MVVVRFTPTIYLPPGRSDACNRILARFFDANWLETGI